MDHNDRTRTVTEADVQFYVDVFAHGDRDARSIALRNLIELPTGDRRVADAIQPLLEDTTPVVLQIPYMFGEMRLLAAAALAAERAARGDNEPVVVRTPMPLKTDQLEEKRLALQLSRPTSTGNPVNNDLALFALLREHGALPDVEFKLQHPVYFSFL